MLRTISSIRSASKRVLRELAAAEYDNAFAFLLFEFLDEDGSIFAYYLNVLIGSLARVQSLCQLRNSFFERVKT